MGEWLQRAFRYDLWANRQWAPLAMKASEAGAPEARLHEVFAHIVWAQRVWLSRVGVEVDGEGDTLLAALNEGWLSVLASRSTDEVIHYRNLKGLPFDRPLGDIAFHVTNHGTYHRGQLREIAGRLGLEYPETDFALWWTLA